MIPTPHTTKSHDHRLCINRGVHLHSVGTPDPFVLAPFATIFVSTSSFEISLHLLLPIHFLTLTIPGARLGLLVYTLLPPRRAGLFLTRLTEGGNSSAPNPVDIRATTLIPVIVPTPLPRVSSVIRTRGITLLALVSHRAMDLLP